MDKYPEDYMKVYAFLFYMTCPNPDLNPFFNMPETDREEMVLKELNCSGFTSEDDEVQEGLRLCEKLYETLTVRAYKGFKTMIDRLALYMETTSIEHGKDGNLTALVNAAKNFDAIRQSFKGVENDLKEEQQALVRGGQEIAYDM
jgi:hypothetical protein